MNKTISLSLFLTIIGVCFLTTTGFSQSTIAKNQSDRKIAPKFEIKKTSTRKLSQSKMAKENEAYKAKVKKRKEKSTIKKLTQATNESGSNTRSKIINNPK